MVLEFSYCKRYAATPIAASQMLVIFDTVIFKIAANGFLLLSSTMHDLNSGQLVNVARTTKPITPLGAWECIAAKETTGSRKYPETIKTTIAGTSQSVGLKEYSSSSVIATSFGRIRKRMTVTMTQLRSQ